MMKLLMLFSKTLLIGFLFLLPSFMMAQTEKQKYMSLIAAKERIRVKKIESFLNNVKSRNLDGNQGNNVLMFTTESQIQRGVAIMQDLTQNTERRIIALNASIHHISENNILITYLLNTLKDKDQPIEFRRAACTTLKSLTFSSRAFHGRRSEFMGTLKQIVEDEDEVLRTEALVYLSSRNDAFAQQKIIEGLKDPSKALLTPEEGIRILGYDMHADFYSVVHEVMLAPPTPAARQEAIRLLGGFEPSRKEIKKYMLDDQENLAIRKICINTLQANDSDNFSKDILPLIADESTDENLRVYTLNALSYGAAKNKIKEDPSYIDSLKKLQNSSSQNVQQTVNKLIRSLSE